MAADRPEQRPPDSPPDSPPDITLRLTYAEIAKRLGISGDAARVLVRRRGWFRIIPNRRGDPTTVVLPEIALVDEQERRTVPPTDGATRTQDERLSMAGAFALLDRTLSRLIEAERRADDATRRAEVDAARVAEIRIELDVARAEARAAQQAAEELRREMEAAKARGRLRRAWDGWRGR